MKKQQKRELWITNISKQSINLSDLAINIKPFASINLLDEKHYYFTDEQIENSINSGSIFRRKDKISIRKLAPETMINPMSINYNSSLPSRKRSSLEIKEEYYEELDLSDEEFADQ